MTDAVSPLALIAHVVAELERIEVTIELDERDRLVLDGPTHLMGDELYAQVERCVDLLRWHAVGAATGHRWAPCSQCGLAALVGSGKKPKCRMTPGCKGTCKRPAPPRKRRRAAIAAAGQPGEVDR